MPKRPYIPKPRRRPIFDDYTPSLSDQRWMARAAAETMRHLPRRDRLDRGENILDFFSRSAPAFGLAEAIEIPENPKPSELLAAYEELQSMLALLGERYSGTSLDKRLTWAGRLIGLTPVDLLVAETAVRHRMFPIFSQMFEVLLDQPRSYLNVRAIAASNGISTQTVLGRMGPTMPLRLSGLIEDQGDDDCRASSFLLQLARLRSTDPERLKSAMLPAEDRPALRWEAFDYLGQDAELAARLVVCAARQRKRANILLYGPPGTGKTEFARAIAAHVGLSAIFVGVAKDDGDEPDRDSRLGHLNMVRALTRRSTGHLIVIDEADDLMFDEHAHMRHSFSKLWVNRLVEGSSGPTIWIVNDPDALGKPVVRRMCMALGFKLPPPSIRAKLVARQALAHGLELGQAGQQALADLKMPAAISAAAIRVAAMVGGEAGSAERVARGLGRALGRYAPPSRGPEAIFDPALSSADHDLVRLTEQLCCSDDRAWSMLLHGMSGTGKSAFARHLAGSIGLELIERRGSELLGPYVGETEQRIAAAFMDAASRGAALLIDEGDALLRDRQLANSGWEVSMVNEWLGWMERHPAPLMITTNLAESLDPATQRRFLFRIRFDPVTPSQAAMLWRQHFEDAPHERLTRVGPLVPADFAVVAKRARLTQLTSPDELLAMLAREVEARQARDGHRIGFAAPQMPAKLNPSGAMMLHEATPRGWLPTAL